MSSGSNPSLRIDSTIIGPEEGIPVLRRMWPSGVANNHELKPFVPTKYSGPTILTGSVGSSRSGWPERLLLADFLLFDPHLS